MFGATARRALEAAESAARAANAAKDMAVAAKVEIEKHEEVCTERWKEARDTMSQVRDSQKWLFRLIITTCLTIIGALLGLHYI